MTEQEKAELEAAEAESKDEAQDVNNSEEEDLNIKKSEEKSEDEINYEEEFKAEREKRAKAEKALAEKRFYSSEKKRKEEEFKEEEEDEKPLTMSEFRKFQDEERQKTEKLLLSREAENIASELAVSDSEKALALEIHKNRTFPSDMSLREQIEESFVIANRKKILGERNEALRALKSKANNDVGSTHHDGQKSKEPQIEAGIKSELSRLGFAFNQTSRRYEKKLANGKILVRDSKTGKITSL